MKMAATPHAFNPQFDLFCIGLFIITLLLFHKYQWFAIISDCQTNKMKNNENFNVINFNEKFNENENTFSQKLDLFLNPL